MSMRAMKEGVHAWPNLSDAERLLQVVDCKFFIFICIFISICMPGLTCLLQVVNCIYV